MLGRDVTATGVGWFCPGIGGDGIGGGFDDVGTTMGA